MFSIMIDIPPASLYNLYSKLGLANSLFCDIKGGYTMKMKKLIAGALAMAMALSLVAAAAATSRPPVRELEPLPLPPPAARAGARPPAAAEMT